ncbi:MAG: glycosyltransferase [Muribaculaceae bacterium]|nr:glycosyltransferase [Muribaculaceae bacterium]
MDKAKEHIISSDREIVLQVLICTYGQDGIERVALSEHPQVDGIKYLVSWQTDGDTKAPKELDRPDFRILPSATKGLSVNRNIALSRASAPIVLISDDDVDYTKEGLLAIVDAFVRNTNVDIVTFRYASSSHTKHYPSAPCDLSTPEKGYFVTSFEIALRRESVQGKIWFNENFGIGAAFPSGEEDIFLRDCLDAGLKGIYLPLTIARHDSTTTSERNLMLASRPQTKGAVFLRLHPRQWPLRMIAHALREIPLWRKKLTPSPISYCLNWLKGVRIARKMKVFPTPDYSFQYPCHEQSE